MVAPLADDAQLKLSLVEIQTQKTLNIRDSRDFPKPVSYKLPVFFHVLANIVSKETIPTPSHSQIRIPRNRKQD